MYPCATFLATDGTLRNIFRTMFCQAQPTIVHSMKQQGTLILVSPASPPPTSTHLHPPPPTSTHLNLSGYPENFAGIFTL